MSFAYFPGCAASGTGRELHASTAAACEAYGVELREIPGWVCCGASAAHMTDGRLARALPAKSLGIARTMGIEGVVTACAACYNRLKIVEAEIEGDEAIRRQCEEDAETDLSGSLEVLHALQLFDAAAVRAKAEPLRETRVACYYGCLLTRPASVSLDPDTVNPTRMDALVAACGLEPVEWPYRTECCGASMVLPRPESVERLASRLLDAAEKCGADAVVVACPLCHSNLDLKQPALRRARPMPVYYITEVLAMALGAGLGRLELGRHTVAAPALTR